MDFVNMALMDDDDDGDDDDDDERCDVVVVVDLVPLGTPRRWVAHPFYFSGLLVVFPW